VLSFDHRDTGLGLYFNDQRLAVGAVIHNAGGDMDFGHLFTQRLVP
jgi:hypothetical protein